MMAKKRRLTGLARTAEQYAMSLIFSASSGTLGKGYSLSVEDTENTVPFKERRALLDSITKLLAIQKDGEDDDGSSGLSSFMERLKDDGDGGEVEGGTDNPIDSEDSIRASDDS